MPPLPVSVGSSSLSLRLGIVQRIVEPRDHARGVAKGRMGGDVLDALAVDVDLAAVAQRLEILRAGLRRRRRSTLPVVSGLAAKQCLAASSARSNDGASSIPADCPQRENFGPACANRCMRASQNINDDVARRECRMTAEREID